MYPKSRHAAEGVCFECHVVAWQYSLHESVELSARFDSLSRALGGADHGAKGGGDRCVFGIERMYYDRSTHALAPRIILEARPAIICVGAFVGPVMIRGITDASTTRRASRPCTRTAGSTPPN